MGNYEENKKCENDKKTEFLEKEISRLKEEYKKASLREKDALNKANEALKREKDALNKANEALKREKEALNKANEASKREKETLNNAKETIDKIKKLEIKYKNFETLSENSYNTVNDSKKLKEGNRAEKLRRDIYFYNSNT